MMPSAKGLRGREEEHRTIKESTSRLAVARSPHVQTLSVAFGLRSISAAHEYYALVWTLWLRGVVRH